MPVRTVDEGRVASHGRRARGHRPVAGTEDRKRLFLWPVVDDLREFPRFGDAVGVYRVRDLD